MKPEVTYRGTQSLGYGSYHISAPVLTSQMRQEASDMVRSLRFGCQEDGLQNGRITRRYEFEREDVRPFLGYTQVKPNLKRFNYSDKIEVAYVCRLYISVPIKNYGDTEVHEYLWNARKGYWEEQEINIQ